MDSVQVGFVQSGLYRVPHIAEGVGQWAAACQANLVNEGGSFRPWTREAKLFVCRDGLVCSHCGSIMMVRCSGSLHGYEAVVCD